MKDKYTHNLINSLDETELLELDFESLIDENELNELDVDFDKIKKKTYKKIGNTNIQKYKNRPIVKIVATIALILLIGTPITLAFVNSIYKYDTNSGRIIKSESPIYILKEPLVKKINGGEIKVSSVIVNQNEDFKNFSHINIDYSVNNVSGFEYIKQDIIANGENIKSSDYSALESYSALIGTDFEPKENSEFKFIVTLMDSNKNTTELEFDLKLEKATSVENYNKLLPQDTKNNITISAFTTQKNNELYAEFIAIPTLEKFDFEIYSFGRNIYQNRGSNIFLIDANGNKIEGEYVEDDMKNNIFKFNTTGLKKPFTLEINEIRVTNTSNNTTKVSLPKLKFGESRELNKTIDIEDKNNLLTKENHEIVIKNIKRKDCNKLDSYILEIEYPNNQNSNFKLVYLNLEPVFSCFGFGSSYFSGTSQSSEKNKSIITLDLQSQEDHDYTGKDEAKEVKFRVSPDMYLINGSWRLTID